MGDATRTPEHSGPIPWIGGAVWTIDGLHGSEPEKTNEVVHFGARHTLHRDGLWMQPEPMLALNPMEIIGIPGSAGSSYAAGNPLLLQDKSGRVPLIALICAACSSQDGGKAAEFMANQAGVDPATSKSIGDNTATVLNEVGELAESTAEAATEAAAGYMRPADDATVPGEQTFESDGVTPVAVGPNGGRVGEYDATRQVEQKEKRDQRREDKSRSENGRNRSGEGSKDKAGAKKGASGNRKKGGSNRHGRQRNVAHPNSEEHSIKPKGTGGTGPRR